MRGKRHISKMGRAVRCAIRCAVLSVSAVVVSCIWFAAEVNDPDGSFMPVLADVNDDNRVYIETVYSEDLMKPSGGGSFGTENGMTASETAFVAVAVYEKLMGLPRSYETYYMMMDDYINKAL